MALEDKLPVPFQGHALIEDAYMNVAYLRVSMGLEFDATTGVITTRFERDEKPVTGSPGEIIANERFYIPQVATEVEKINFGFVLGYILAQLEAKSG